jgi:gamma-glutamylcyclotransferase (GGCT)/AIG2-like uncharacterized protein YtfP
MRQFFFYGTLLAGSGNAVEEAVHRKLRAVGPGVVSGRLYAIPDPEGWYPALLAGRQAVRGMIYAAGTDFRPGDLLRLDAYEDCRPRDPKASLYLRKRIQVRGEEGRILVAEAYRYNRPLPKGARPIAHGDFTRWLRAFRCLPFSPRRTKGCAP